MASDTLPLVVNIAGHPHPQPRPRFVGKGRVVSTATKGAKLWRGAVVAAGKAAVADRQGSNAPSLCAGAVSVEILFLMPTPDAARHGQAHTHKPDVDNLAKLVLDGLVEAGAIPQDDAAVARLCVSKAWAARGGAAVVVSPLHGQIFGGGVDAVAPGWLAGAV